MHRSLARFLGIYLCFAVLCGVVYSPAVDGPFLSDDNLYISETLYSASLSPSNIAELWSPSSDIHAYVVNYAPVQLTIHAIQRQLFGSSVLGYHWTNILLHALNATLLVALLVASGLPLIASLLGGVFFAFHPANVEAVAWVSQLKSVGAMAFALTAILVHPRWPVSSVPLFALALLTKAMAAFALPFAIALLWCRGAVNRRQWVVLAIWGAILVAVLIPQFAAHGNALEIEVEAYDDLGVRIRSMAAYGARYLVMAVSTFGISPYQQLEPSISWMEPWWLLALPLGIALGWRTMSALRDRREEGAWWLAAVAGFLPVSQWLAFQSAVADRYLYFILPGLIGGAMLAGKELARSFGSTPAWAPRVAVALASMTVVLFAVQSFDRASLWQSTDLLMREGARHYPDSSYANFQNGLDAVERGELDEAIRAMRRSIQRGTDPRYVWYEAKLAPLRSHPAFEELIRVELDRWLARARQLGWSSRPRLSAMAEVEFGLGRPAAALELLEQALATDGPFENQVRQSIQELRQHVRPSG